MMNEKVEMMNKQEVIEKIQGMKRFIEEADKGSYEKGLIDALDYALSVTKDLDEPEKPVVPQFVADFYESIKDDFEDKLYELCLQFNNDSGDLPREIWWWFDCGKNEPIQTLVKMKLFGYEVEKEKLYTVELPNPNAGGHVVLCKTRDGIVSITFAGTARWRGGKNVQLTKSEIKKDFEWAWQFAKEVDE